MKTSIIAFLLFFSLSVKSQTYQEKVSFKSELWTIEYAEEALIGPDSVGITWTKKSVKRRKNVIYVDISSEGTLIGIKYPKVLKLTSEGLDNNGFIGEKHYKNDCMYIQSYARDETGNLWLVTVGKDRFTPGLENDPTGQGRIYLTIQDVNQIQSGWYFAIQTFGNK
jgi:hypothetical protein